MLAGMRCATLGSAAAAGLLAILSALGPANALAAEYVTLGRTPMCLDRGSLEAALRAIVGHDAKRLRQIDGCYSTVPGLRAVLLERDPQFELLSKVRIYAPKGTAVVWMPYDGLREKR